MAQSELQWTPYKDFTGGLYERGDDRECPPNGLLVADDCMPLRTGGLRAGPRWTTFLDSSVPATAFGMSSNAGIMCGFGYFFSLPNRRSARFLMFISTAFPAVIDVFGSTSTAASTEASSWVKVSSRSSVRDQHANRFVDFVDIGNSIPPHRVFYNVANNADAIADVGIFRLTSNSSAASQVYADRTNALTAHQGRLVGMGIVGEGFQEIVYSDVQSATNIGATTNSYFVALQNSGTFTHLEPYFPSDLQMLKAQWGWFSLQGDITSPQLRQASFAHPSQVETWAAQTPRGLAYLTQDQGVWVFAGGNFPTPLSPQFVGTPMAEPTLDARDTATVGTAQLPFMGQVIQAGDWLITPKGYVLDFATGAWWKTTQLNTTPQWSFFGEDRIDGIVYAARSSSSGAAQILYTRYNEATMLRAQSYTFTLPLIYNPNTATVLRELEYHLQTFTADATIDVTVEYLDNVGVTQTVNLAQVTIPKTNVRPVRIQVGQTPGGGSINADWVKVTTTLASVSGEAPMLERMLVGTQPGSPYRAET